MIICNITSHIYITWYSVFFLIKYESYDVPVICVMPQTSTTFPEWCTQCILSHALLCHVSWCHKAVLHSQNDVHNVFCIMLSCVMCHGATKQYYIPRMMYTMYSVSCLVVSCVMVPQTSTTFPEWCTQCILSHALLCHVSWCHKAVLHSQNDVHNVFCIMLSCVMCHGATKQYYIPRMMYTMYSVSCLVVSCVMVPQSSTTFPEWCTQCILYHA